MIPLPAASGEWMVECLGNVTMPELLFADASFRSYYRVNLDHRSNIRDKTSLVLMHAPPEHESLETYVCIARNWHKQGINTPQIWFDNQQLGLALIEDFGDDHLLNVGNNVGNNEAQLYWYKLALQQMLQIATIAPAGLPDFYTSSYSAEMQLLPQWAVAHYRLDFDQERWQELTARLLDTLKSMPQASCHMDFHSRNLMRLNKQDCRIGVLDFQDACRAPRSYDLASLVFDAYTDLHSELVEELIQTCATVWQVDASELMHELHLTALQRLLKVYGIFCRLNSRDNKPGYLQYLPRVSRNINHVCDSLIAAGENWLAPHLAFMRNLQYAAEHPSCVH